MQQEQVLTADLSSEPKIAKISRFQVQQDWILTVDPSSDSKDAKTLIFIGFQKARCLAS
jgi:hypothetical protein